jgi:tetraprenyl-beta-curcumene synthase
VSAFGDHRSTTRAVLALIVANIRFWPTVAPALAAQLERWERSANAIEDPRRRRLALVKLSDERFNSEVAATLATLAPRGSRKLVVEAIVAYEVMYDYLDGLTEQPTSDPIRDGHELYRAFTDAITLDTPPTGNYHARHEGPGDSDYLDELVETVRGALARLPAAHAVSSACVRAATRCAEAQIRAHAAPSLGAKQLERWATSQTEGTDMGWQEFLAGAASSVLSVHALIAAAADIRTNESEADEIDTVYLSICAVSTLLDSLIDHDRDQLAGQSGYVAFYDSHDLIARDLTNASRRAVEHATPLRNGAHHLMTLAGVASYYLSAPSANSSFAKPVAQHMRRELRPLVTPTLAVMHAWRLAKRIRRATRRQTGRASR